MRVVPCVMVLAVIGLGLTGCSHFKKAGDRPPSVPNNNGKPPARFPGGEDPLLKSTAGPSADTNGMIAGTVISPPNYQPREALVSYVCLDDGKTEGAPIDVAVDPKGYFTIRGLKPNKAYKLIARAKDGDKVLAGVTYARPPDIHVWIRLSPDLAGPGTPGFPDPPAYQPKKDDPKKTTLLPRLGPLPAPAGPTWQPGPAAAASVTGPTTGRPGLGLGTPRPLVEPELPARVNVPPPAPIPPPPPTGGWVPGIAGQEKNWPPVMDMRKPIQIKPPIPLPEKPPAADPGAALTPPRVPSCVLVGNQLHSLALHDLSGQPWEFKTQRKGKLVLFDFWNTTCMPCRESIPNLVALQTRYAPALEIVGIAYENGGTPQEQAYRVHAVGQRLHVNYRQLLGGGARCPVMSQFAVRGLPTLVLVDESGTIVWRHEGLLDPNHREDLELLIQRKLGLR